MRFSWKYLKEYKKYIFLNFITAIGFILIEIGIPTLLARGINNNFNNLNTQYIVRLGFGMLGFALFGLGCLILQAYSTNRMANGVVRDMRNDIFRKVQQFSHDEFEKFGIAQLITNTGNDCFIIMQFLTMALRTGIIAPLMMIASLVMIFRHSPLIALLTLIAVPITTLAVMLINHKTRPLSQKQQKGLDKINLQMRESLTGLRVIRAFNNEGFQSGRFEESNKEYSALSQSMFKTVAFTSPSFTLVFCIIMIFVVTVGSVQVQNLSLQFGNLAAFIEYVFHALFSFLMLANVFIMYPRMAVASSRIQQVLEEDITIKPNLSGVTESKTQGVVEFKNVSFAYADNSEEPVIRNISFTAEPGKTIAFIGSTGSGKSTLIQLIPRFFDVTHGEILIDGVDVRDYKVSSLREKIGYVPQRALLFSGTVEENLKFGNEKANKEDMLEALEIAQALDFVMEKEDGLQEQLSEGGSNLSGGQKQRLCIARALIRKAPIYIFDDSFSALDYQTDTALRHRLSQETENATVMIVAQRVSTIMDADKIIVLDKGRVVGTGTHKELLKSCEIYYEIASSQLTKEELER